MLPTTISAGAVAAGGIAPTTGARKSAITNSRPVTIAVTPTAVTITPDRAPARTFHTNGKEEEIAVGRVTASVNAHWEGNRLIIVYTAETGRELLLRGYQIRLRVCDRGGVHDVDDDGAGCG